MSGLRERKKAETRTALSWAAISLTVEHGFDNVKVEDIASAAGVSPRTFNNYFASKAEAIVSRHLDRCLRAADELRRRPADEPLWRAITAAAIAQFQPGPELEAMPMLDQTQWVAGLRAMVVEPALQGEMLRAGAAAEAEIAVAVAERTGTDVHQDIYPHLVAAALTTATNVAMQHYLRTGPSVGMDTLLPDALAQIAAGLPPPPRPARTTADPPARAAAGSPTP
jgi:AcrR family transcriptional regulator